MIREGEGGKSFFEIFFCLDLADINKKSVFSDQHVNVNHQKTQTAPEPEKTPVLLIKSMINTISFYCVIILVRYGKKYSFLHFVHSVEKKCVRPRLVQRGEKGCSGVKTHSPHLRIIWFAPNDDCVATFLTSMIWKLALNAAVGIKRIS